MTENRTFASLSSNLLARKGAARPAMRRPTMHGLLNSGVAHDDLGWNDMGYDVDPPQDDNTGVVRSLNGNPLAAAIPETTPDVRRQQEEIAAKLNIGFDAAIHVEDEGQMPQPEAHAFVAEEPEMPVVAAMEQYPVAAIEEAAVVAINEEVVVDIPPHDMPAPVEGSPLMARKTARPVETLASFAQPEVRIAQPAESRHDALASVKAGPKAAFTLRLTAERHMRLRLACAVKGLSAQKLVTEALDEFLRQMPEIEHLMEHVPAR